MNSAYRCAKVCLFISILLTTADPIYPDVDDLKMEWGTFLGGYHWDKGLKIASDKNNNVYVTGYTWSDDFPTVNGAYTVFGGGDGDAYVAKYNSNGVLEWSTYLGGDDKDQGWDIATDKDGNIYAAGWTESKEFPIKEAWDDTFEGYMEAYVIRFNSNGTIEWATFLGGDYQDWGFAVATDGEGNVFLTGSTKSKDFPTLNAHFPNYTKWTDAFVSKFDSDGTLLWSTYLGGSNEEEGMGLATDSDGSVYVVGATDSGDFPTLNAYDSSFNGGYRDAFVCKFSKDGALMWSTFLGGNNWDEGLRIVADGDGNVYAAGYTMSPNFPTDNGHDKTIGGNMDVFVTKFDSDGDLQWSSYLGGKGQDQARDIRLDVTGSIIIGGHCYCGDFPGPVKKFGLCGDYSAFVSRLESGGAPLWTVMIGGSYTTENVEGLAFDDLGNVYAGGSTSSPDFPTPGGYDTSYNGRDEAFLVKLSGSVGSWLTGTVKGEDGSFVSGAIVSTDAGPRALTGDDGKYLLIVPSGRGYRLLVRAAGYKPEMATDIDAFPDKETTVDFVLTPVDEEYKITEIYPDAETVSEIDEGGIAVRYYQVLTKDGGIPSGIVNVEWEAVNGGGESYSGSSLTNTDGEVYIWIDTKNFAEAKDTLTGKVLYLNGVPFAENEEPAFTVYVRESVLELSYQQQVNGDLSGSILGKGIVGGEAGYDLVYVGSPSSSDPTGMLVRRKIAESGGLGVSATLFEAGASYEATDFKAGASVEVGADAQAMAVLKNDTAFSFDPDKIFGSSPDWDQSAAAYVALNDAFGWVTSQAPRQGMGMDAALLYILTWAEQRMGEGGGPLTALQNAYSETEAGLSISGEAGAQITGILGVTNQATNKVNIGLSGMAGLKGKAEGTVALAYTPAEEKLVPSATLRMEGTLSTAISLGAKLDLSGKPGQGGGGGRGTPNTQLGSKKDDARKNLGISLFNNSNMDGLGLEYRHSITYQGEDLTLKEVGFEVAPFEISGATTTTRKHAYKATSDDPAVLTRFNSAAGTNIGQLMAFGAGVAASLGFGSHEDLMFGFIDVCNDIVNGTQAEKLKLAVEVCEKRSVAVSDISLELKGKLLGTGGQIKLGNQANEVLTVPVYRGVWLDGRDLITEDYTWADFERPDFPTLKETQQKLVDTLIISALEEAWEQVVKVAEEGIATVVEVGEKVVEFAEDALETGTQVIVTGWRSLTGGKGEEKAISERILKAARKQAGIEFGIGGFVNIQIQDGSMSGPAVLTFGYEDSDVTGVDESRLAVFLYDTESAWWTYVGGTPDPDLNRVVAAIDSVGTYALAPIAPDGLIPVSAVPQSVPLSETSVSEISCGSLVDSAGETVPDDTPYTIATDLGDFVATDALADTPGKQVLSSSGMLSFQLKPAMIGGTATVRVASVAGRAVGEATVEFHDDDAPSAPASVVVRPDEDAALISWAGNPEPDLAGYLIYYGTQTGGPYEGGGTVRSVPSPARVGLATRAFLPGLETGTVYYVVLTAVDVAGNESPFSEQVLVAPGLKGDLDGNGMVTSQDVLWLLECYGTGGYDPNYLPLGDVNSDWRIDLKDLFEIIRLARSPDASVRARKARLMRGFSQYGAK